MDQKFHKYMLLFFFFTAFWGFYLEFFSPIAPTLHRDWSTRAIFAFWFCGFLVCYFDLSRAMTTHFVISSKLLFSGTVFQSRK